MTDKKIIELTPFRADLARAIARRGERMLTSPDLAAQVASLEPLEAYYMVREIGLDQSLPILLEFSNEQLQTCVDLDGWNRHNFGVDSLDEWLKAYSQAGHEALAKAFFALDYVVQLLFFSQTVTVYDPDTDQVPEEDKEQETPRVVTPDGFFILELKTELDLKIHPYALLDALYQYDPAAAHQLLRGVRVDLSTQIEEEALRFRNNRMEDIGFVGPDEAAVLFSRSATGQSTPQLRDHIPLDLGTIRLPSVYASRLTEKTLLEQALSLITDQEALSRLEQEIVWTINSAIIAYGEKTQNIKQIADIAERVRDTISLGLEALLVEPDSAAATKASDLLTTWSIIDLFRYGFAATLDLQQEVEQAMAEPVFLTWYELADTEQSEQADETTDRLERAFVAALRGLHPLRGGFDPAEAGSVKAFASLAEIKTAQVRLKRLIAKISV
jgi:hypothetical protein